MSLDELRDATKEFDKPVPFSRMKPLTKAERQRFERARQAGVRSIYVHKRRPKTVKLELDEAIISKSNDYASRHNMSLSELVERSLRSALTFVH